MKRTIIILPLLLMLLLLTALLTSNTQSPSIAKVSSMPSSDRQKELNGAIRAYTQKVEEVYESYELLTIFDFFLFDITGDGMPELWLDHGSCEADRHLSIYTYGNSSIKTLYNDGIDHAEFYREGDHIIMCSAHMDHAYYHRFTYDGKIRDTIVFEQHLSGELAGDDYISPEEPEIPSFATDEQTEDVEEYISKVISRLILEEGNHR